MSNRSRFGQLRWAAAVFAVATAACAPAVPDLTGAAGDNAVGASAEVNTAPTPSSTTTTAPSTSVAATTTSPPTTEATTTSTTTTTTTTAAPGTTLPPVAQPVTVGAWTVSEDRRDESGAQFTATVGAPVLTASTDQALLARVATLIEGRVQTQVGATLALWRSIESQGDRDLTGSALTLLHEIAAFEDDFISLRFFSDEQVAGSSGPKRQVTTLMIDLQSGVAIGLDDVIVSGESRTPLLALVEAGLLRDHFNGDADAFALWAGDLAVGDLDRAVLTRDGLEVWFDELEVGPPDIGVPVVVIPYSDLGDILDPVGAGSIFA